MVLGRLRHEFRSSHLGEVGQDERIAAVVFVLDGHRLGEILDALGLDDCHLQAGRPERLKRPLLVASGRLQGDPVRSERSQPPHQLRHTFCRVRRDPLLVRGLRHLRPLAVRRHLDRDVQLVLGNIDPDIN